MGRPTVVDKIRTIKDKKMFCSKCGGSGYFWDYDPEIDEVVLILCNECDGTGEIESEE